MALTKEQIQSNKDKFISLIMSIHREGANLEGLVKKLESSDFFYAPASAQYHCCYEGGLCEHSLNVYEQLVKIIESECTVAFSDDTGTTYLYEKTNTIFDSESLKIVGLLHDFSKMNFYEPTVFNKKVYSETGSKFDEQGKYDWVSQKSYKVKDRDERFLFGTHGQNSEYMTGSYIPLKLEESVAIIWHMGGMDNQNAVAEVSNIYNKYPLAAMIHLADMLATYIDERI